MKTTRINTCSTNYVRQLLDRGWGIHRMMDGELAMFFCSSRRINGMYRFARIAIREVETVKCDVRKLVRS